MTEKESRVNIFISVKWIAQASGDPNEKFVWTGNAISRCFNKWICFSSHHILTKITKKTNVKLNSPSIQQIPWSAKTKAPLLRILYEKKQKIGESLANKHR
jgi:hypothetical protein